MRAACRRCSRHDHARMARRRRRRMRHIRHRARAIFGVRVRHSGRAFRTHFSLANRANLSVFGEPRIHTFAMIRLKKYSHSRTFTIVSVTVTTGQKSKFVAFLKILQTDSARLFRISIFVLFCGNFFQVRTRQTFVGETASFATQTNNLKHKQILT